MDQDPSDAVPQLSARTSSADLAGITTPHGVTESPAHVELPRVAIDDQLRAVATWRSFNSSEEIPNQGGDNATPERLLVEFPVTLGDLGEGINVGSEPQSPRILAGDATVAWGASSVIRAAWINHGEAFGTAVPISNASHTGSDNPPPGDEHGGRHDRGLAGLRPLRSPHRRRRRRRQARPCSRRSQSPRPSRSASTAPMSAAADRRMVGPRESPGTSATGRAQTGGIRQPFLCDAGGRGRSP